MGVYSEAVLATSGLVSLWELGEVGASAADLKGSNTGTYQGSPSQGQTSLLPNGEGKSVDLVPATQFISIADSASLDLSDGFSLEALIRPDIVNSNRAIISKGLAAYYLRVGSAGKIELLKSQTSVICTATVALTKETPYYVLATKNAATVKLYQAELKVGSTLSDVTGSVANATCTDNILSVNLGGDTGFSTERFDGRMQYAAVYNTAISQATGESHLAATQPAAGGTGQPVRFLSRRNRIIGR